MHPAVGHCSAICIVKILKYKRLAPAFHWLTAMERSAPGGSRLAFTLLSHVAAHSIGDLSMFCCKTPQLADFRRHAHGFMSKDWP